MDLVKIAPEALEVANTYITTGSITETAAELGLAPQQVQSYLDRREVRSYVDNIFLDQGYRNRFRLFELLDRVIDSKLEEAAESEMYTSKDLVDLIALAHKMRSDLTKTEAPRVQTNVQVNGDNYGALLSQLLCSKESS